MSRWYKHVAKNHEIAKKLETGAELAKLQNEGLTSEMVTNGPHQCVRQTGIGGGCAEILEKQFEIFLFHLGKNFPDP